MNFILASASERRKELLSRIIKKFNIIISDFDEQSVIFDGDCGEYVRKLALGKAKTVANNLENKSIIIGSDTVVYQNGKILGKPKNDKDAFNMLKSLSGTYHEVYSGIAIINKYTDEVKTDFVCTQVFFSKLSDEEISNYIKSREPMDKAGAYGIQGNGGIFVEKIHGCYYNVVGLPLNRLYYMLREMGVNL